MRDVNMMDSYFSLVNPYISNSIKSFPIQSNRIRLNKFIFQLLIVCEFHFSITEFQDNLKQRLSTNTEAERTDWIQAIRHASYEEMRKKLQALREQIEKRRDNKQDIDVDMMRLQIGKEIGENLIEF